MGHYFLDHPKLTDLTIYFVSKKYCQFLYNDSPYKNREDILDMQYKKERGTGLGLCDR